MHLNETPNRAAEQGKWHRLGINALVACLFAAAILAIPWESIQGYPFVDRKVYLSYFLYEVNVLDYVKFYGIMDYLKNEVLWHWAMRFAMHDLGLSPQTVLSSISFLCLSVSAYFLLSTLRPLSLLLLINPLLIDLAFSQLRLALAFSLLLLSYMSRRNLVLALAFAICAFIHTAIFLFAGICIGLWAIKKWLIDKGVSRTWILFACFLLGVCGSIAIGPAAERILASIGDRRAQTYTIDFASGWKYILFWFGLLAICALQRDRFYRNAINAYSIVVLSLVSSTLLTGGYTSRILAVSLPMLIVTMFHLGSRTKSMSIVAFVLYAAAQWMYQLNISVV